MISFQDWVSLVSQIQCLSALDMAANHRGVEAGLRLPLEDALPSHLSGRDSPRSMGGRVGSSTARIGLINVPYGRRVDSEAIKELSQNNCKRRCPDLIFVTTKLNTSPEDAINPRHSAPERLCIGSGRTTSSL